METLQARRAGVDGENVGRAAQGFQIGVPAKRDGHRHADPCIPSAAASSSRPNGLQIELGDEEPKEAVVGEEIDGAHRKLR